MKLVTLNKFALVSLAFVVLFTTFSLHSAQINMRDADIRAFASDMAKISNKTIVLDPRVKGNVTVVSNQDLDAGEAYAVFLSVLRVHGYAAIENVGYLMSSNYESAWSIDMVKVRYYPLVMHMGFGVLMGFLLSQNLFEERSDFKRRLMLIMSLAFPVTFHGIYNYYGTADIFPLLTLIFVNRNGIYM